MPIKKIPEKVGVFDKLTVFAQIFLYTGRKNHVFYLPLQSNPLGFGFFVFNR